MRKAAFGIIVLAVLLSGCSAYFNGERLRYNRDYFDVEEYEKFISGYIPEQSGN